MLGLAAWCAGEALEGQSSGASIGMVTLCAGARHQGIRGNDLADLAATLGAGGGVCHLEQELSAELVWSAALEAAKDRERRLRSRSQSVAGVLNGSGDYPRVGERAYCVRCGG